MDNSPETPRWKKILRAIAVLAIIGFLTIWLSNFKPKTKVLSFDPNVPEIAAIDTVVIDIPIDEKLTSIDSADGDYKTSRNANCSFCGLTKEEKDTVRKNYDKNCDTVGQLYNKKNRILYLYVEHN